MKHVLREEAIRLRLEEELSYSAIRKRLNVPKSTLSYWLREYPLSEEKILELRRKGWQKGEASRERYRNTMRRKKKARLEKYYREGIQQFQNLSEESLYVAGLMLYLAEGTKKKRGQINIANTDPLVIAFFIQWLEYFFEVSKDEIRIQLHLYENMNIAKERNFWKNTLGIKESQFYKLQVRPVKEKSFSYKESFRHGTCSLYTFGEERRMKLVEDIRALLDTVQNMRV